MYCFRNLLTRFPKTFKTIPTSYLDSLSYEDQLNWLCAIILELKDSIDNGGGGGVIPEGLEEDINNLKQAVEQLQQTTQQLSNENNVQNESIQTLTQSLQQTNASVQGLQQGIANLGQQLHTLTNRVSSLETRVTALEEAMASGGNLVPDAAMSYQQTPEIYESSFSPVAL